MLTRVRDVEKSRTPLFWQQLGPLRLKFEERSLEGYDNASSVFECMLCGEIHRRVSFQF
jgi:hypothetical protein